MLYKMVLLPARVSDHQSAHMEDGLAVLLPHILKQLVPVLVPRDHRLWFAKGSARDPQSFLRFLRKLCPGCEGVARQCRRSHLDMEGFQEKFGRVLGEAKMGGNHGKSKKMGVESWQK